MPAPLCLICRERTAAYRVRAAGVSARDRFACRRHLAAVVDYVTVPGQAAELERLAP